MSNLGFVQCKGPFALGVDLLSSFASAGTIIPRLQVYADPGFSFSLKTKTGNTENFTIGESHSLMFSNLNIKSFKPKVAGNAFTTVDFIVEK